MSCPEISQKTKHIPTGINLWCYKRTLFLFFFFLRSHFQPCAEQCQQNSSATVLSLHSDEGSGRAALSAQDAILILTRMDVFNALCHSESNR